MGRRLVLVLLFTAALAGAISAQATEAAASESSIREAYERRQQALALRERAQIEDQNRRESPREPSWSLPITAKSAIVGFCLIVLGSIADRHRWLPSLLGNEVCRRMGYPFLCQGQKYWPSLRGLPTIKIHAPKRIPLLQNAFLDPDSIEDDGEDRLVINLAAIEKYTDEDLGLDPGSGSRLRPTQCPFPVGHETFSKAA